MSPAAAASAAWLAKIPASERLAAAARTDARLMVWLGAGALLVAGCLVLARADLAGRIRRAIERDRPRPWLASAATAAVVALALALLKAAYDVTVAGPVEGAAGSLTERIAAAGGVVAPAVTLAVLLVPPLQWLFRVWPRLGPVLAGGAAIAVIVGLGWGPYAVGSGADLIPAPAGPVRDGLERLIAGSGVPAHGVYLSQQPGFDADVTGGFGRARVIIGREVLAWSPAEARAYVGHLMGHYAHGDIFAIFLIFGLAGAAALVAIQALAAPLARAMGGKGVTRASQTEALPAAALILVLAWAAATLAVNGYISWANVRADEFSLSTAREPDGLAAVLERTWDHESVDPNPLEEALFYSHPPLAKRLDHAMTWKAAQSS